MAVGRGQDLGLWSALVWQGSVYAAWLPIALVVWLVLRRFGSGLTGLLALYLAGGLVVPLEALISALVDTAFAPGPSLAIRLIGRLPICLLLYTAIVAVGLAAAEHREAREERERSLALEVALEHARRAAGATSQGAALDERLTVMSGARRVPVKISEVEWFGGADNYVVVHWSDREGLLRGTLKAIEKRLDPTLFARCHRSALVNLARVESFTPLSDGSWRLTMESGAEVVTSRGYRAQLLQRLGL